MSGSEPATPDDIIAALEQVAQTGEPAPGSARLLDVGTEPFVRCFEQEVLDTLLAGGGATVRVFEGPYGTGKTHLLDLLHDLGLRRGMAIVRTTLSQALSLSDWRLVTQHVLQNIELSVDGEITRSLPRVLEALPQSRRLTDAAIGAGALPHPGVSRAMDLLVRRKDLGSEGRELLHRFLLGERVRVSELRRAGATGVRNPLSARNAEQVLKTALVGLLRLGVQGTMLLFDENEHTFVFQHASPPLKVTVGANLLRRLIDASAGGGLVGSVAVFAVLPGFVQHCALAYPALGQRLHTASGDRRSSWRWPVLRVDAVGSAGNPEAFLSGVVDRMEQLAAQCGARQNGLRQQLTAAGRDVLAHHAGSDHRRMLMKRLATIVVREL